MVMLGYIIFIFPSHINNTANNTGSRFTLNNIILPFISPGAQPSKLEAVSNGEMKTYYKSDADRNAVIAWIKSGANKTQYDTAVAPILNKSCIGCHSPSGSEPKINLTTYTEVKKYTIIK
jgi:hypothetical protein